MKLLIFTILVTTQVNINFATFPGQTLSPAFLANFADPLILDSIRINEEGLNFELKDFHLHGMNQLNLVSYSFDPITCSSRFTVCGDLSGTGRYYSNGTIFSSPIFGNGDAVIDIKNVDIEVVTQYDVVKGADGLDYARAKGYQFWYDVKGGFRNRYTNLYNGNKELSDRMHYLFDQNWKLLTEIFGRQFFRPVMDTWFNAWKNVLLPLTPSNV